MRQLITFALVLVMAAASYGAASLFGDRERNDAEACGIRRTVPAAQVAGDYTSNYGSVTLAQSGNRITGSYECCGSGTITGTIRGNVIRYTWTQPDATGRGIWVAKENTLTGTWGWKSSSDSGGAWNLSKRPQIAIGIR